MDQNPNKNSPEKVFPPPGVTLPRTVAGRLERERLVVEAPDEAMHQAVEDAKKWLIAWKLDMLGGQQERMRRVSGRSRAVEPRRDAGATSHSRLSSTDVGRNGMALLAAGEFDAAYDALLFLSARLDDRDRKGPEQPAPGGGRETEGRDEEVLCYLLLAARFIAWTGERRRLTRVWDVVRHVAGLALDVDHPPAAFAPFVAPVVAELADAAESLADSQLAAVARSRLGQGGNAPPHAGVRQRPLAAFGRREARPFGALDPARTLLFVVHDLVGAAPDAPRHRVVLRPRIPAEWSRFEARRLRIGDAAVALHYRRDGGTHIFRLEQERGAIPLRLIFEPLLPAMTLTGARIDGQAATLDAERLRERLLVPVQLVLDHERTVLLECGAPPAH